MKLSGPTVAYFSMEVALESEIPTYSGGLGVLAGDVLRAAADLSEYSDARTDKYAAMVEAIRKRLGLTTLRYQTLNAMVEAIGMPREKLCTYCWNGESLYESP